MLCVWQQILEMGSLGCNKTKLCVTILVNFHKQIGQRALYTPPHQQFILQNKSTYIYIKMKYAGAFLISVALFLLGE